jgi:hypothetical protein
MNEFMQPFSWGVKNSPFFTVVHAADFYDYEHLPLWCSLRFNLPIVGGYCREKHCLNMIGPLVANGYKSFAVPWGAAHAPLMHAMLTENGFKVVSVSRIVAWRAADGPHSHQQIRYLSRVVHISENWMTYLSMGLFTMTLVAMIANMFQVVVEN